MPINIHKLEELLLQAFNDAQIEIKALAGDEDHYALTISSSLFNNKSKLEQHKMVNQALDGYLGTKLHALSIKTKSRSE